MKRLVKAVAIITIFAVLTRALGFLLRIYMSRKLGAEVLGMYQVSITVFGVFCTLISSGIPIIISRSVASSYASHNYKKEHQIVSSGILISLCLSIILSALVLLFPDILNFVFTSHESLKILFWLLPGVIATSIYAAFRGALWGQKRFFWISCSEFFEQLSRIILIIILFECCSKLSSAGELAAISLSAACILSAILVTILYFIYGGRLTNPFIEFKPLIKNSTPITAIRTASSLGQFLIAIIIPIRLVASGMTKSTALSLFGIASGMALPLIMIPGTIIGALATAIVPDLSEIAVNQKMLANNPKLNIIKSRVNTSINATLVIAFMLVPVFLVLGPQIGMFLFASKEAGIYVSRAALLMIPMCISQISSSLMNAIGMENRSLLHYAAGSTLLFLSVYFLPKIIGINALIVGLGMLFTTTSVLNLILLAKRGLMSKIHAKTALILLFYIVPSALSAKYTYLLFNMFCPSNIALIIAGIISVSIYLFLCVLFHQFDIQIFFSKRKSKKQVKENIN